MPEAVRAGDLAFEFGFEVVDGGGAGFDFGDDLVLFGEGSKWPAFPGGQFTCSHGFIAHALERFVGALSLRAEGISSRNRCLLAKSTIIGNAAG